jgi:glc operon protein GlcG
MALTRSTPVLTLEAAKQLALAAEAEAMRRGWTVAVAVVDPSGGLILFHSIDGTQPASQDIAVAKARTAARFKRPTKALEDALTSRPPLATVSGLVALEGGIPITREGLILGAIGVSGMTSAEDGMVASAAVEALTRALEG